jgi:erythronate-4-phosphate dehydrogenase
MMKIIADENMPFVRELFSQIGDVQLLPGRSMDADQISDADLLLVRSVTRINSELLSQARNLKFVGSAAVGTEHIDTQYLQSGGIAFANAPGCNRLAVSEYVLSSLLRLSEKYGFDLPRQTVGIVGAGNTGTAVSEKLAALGIKVRLCDPPLQRSGDGREFFPLEQVLKSDIVSLHVPLTRSGFDATWHLLDHEVLDGFRSDQYLINASRGAVIDNQALLAIKAAGGGPVLVLDVWEGEPDIELALLPHVSLATPHIAGHSLEGKARGTLMVYQAACQMLGQTPTTTLNQLLPPARISRIDVDASRSGHSWRTLVPLIYDVSRDDRMFRQHVTRAGGFDRLRKEYWARREFSSLTVSSADPETASQLSRLGFTLE